jgi:hypothetical protein
MKTFITFALLPALCWIVTSGSAADDKKDPRAALQAFNEYIGSWQGDGTAKKDQWTESIEWGWKFKGNDAWLVFKIKDGKFLKSGEVRPIPGKEGVYKLIAEDVKGNKLDFEGKIEKENLRLFRTDPDTKEQQRLTMFIAGDGVFFNYNFAQTRAGTKFFTEQYVVRAKKDGEVIKPGSKQPVCVVSGGLGTTAVTHKGVTYYVCCSGCRDAFADDPEKWIKEFEAKKKK